MKKLRLPPTLAAFLLLAVLGIATASDVPVSDDARFYVPAAAAYGRWAERVMTFDLAALSATEINRAFRHNREHPPVAKYVMAAGWLLLHRWTGITDEVSACRFGVILLWAWMCAIVFAWVRNSSSLIAGIFAALALATMPRLLYHAHAETLDLPITAFLLLAGHSLFRCLEKPSLRTGIVTTVFFALALGTKLNAPFFLVAAVTYLLLWQVPRLDGLRLHLPPMPWVLAALCLVAPLLAWALWPWLWFDTFNRLGAYLAFHLKHYGIFFYYGGAHYGDEVAPWSAPWVMTALTLPVPILGAALLGAARPLRTLAARLPGLRRFAWPSSLDTPSLRLATFALLQAGMQIGAVSLPSVPKYGGIKLFLPALPFIAILAGLGFQTICDEIGRHFPGRRRLAISAATGALLLLPGILGAVAYRHSWLSYYNTLAGGVAGATASGYERQYYDLGYPQMAAAISRHLPQGGLVAVVPNPKEYGPHLGRWQRQGMLPPTIRLAPLERAELVILTHERRWLGYPELMARLRSRHLLERFEIAGIPMFSVYAGR